MHSYPYAERKPDTIDSAWITPGFLENKRSSVGLENTRLPNFIKLNIKRTTRVSWTKKNKEV